MDNPLRKKPRARKLPRRVTLPLLALAAALCALALHMAKQPATLPEVTPAASTSVKIIDREAAELVSLAVTDTKGRTVRFTCQDGALALEGQPDAVLDEDRVQNLLALATSLTVADTVTDLAQESGAKAGDFGLGENALTMTAAYADGTRAVLRVGDQIAFMEPESYYCMLEGDSHVYLVYAYVRERLEINEMTAHKIEQHGLDAQRVESVRITGERTLSLTRAATGWQITAPFAYPAIEERVETLLENLENLRFAGYVGKTSDLAAYGLDAPRLTVTLSLCEVVTDGEPAQVVYPAETWTLALGGAHNELSDYALYNGAVYTVTFFSGGFLNDIDPADFALRAPFSFAMSELTALTAAVDGASASYTMRLVERVQPNNELETDDYGGVLYDLAVYRDGQAADIDAFTDWYVALTSVAPAGTLPEGFVPEGEQTARFVLAVQGGMRTVAFYPYDALHDAMAVDGVCRYYVRSSFRQMLAQMP